MPATARVSSIDESNGSDWVCVAGLEYLECDLVDMIYLHSGEQARDRTQHEARSQPILINTRNLELAVGKPFSWRTMRQDLSLSFSFRLWQCFPRPFNLDNRAIC